MPVLPHDPSVYVDHDVIAELIEEFSLRLRRDPATRPVMDAAVGNRWYEFERGMHALCEALLLQLGGHEAFTDALFDSADTWTSDAVGDIERIFLDACFSVMSMNSAAAVSRHFERAAEILREALDHPPEGRARALEAARRLVRSGNLFR